MIRSHSIANISCHSASEIAAVFKKIRKFSDKHTRCTVSGWFAKFRLHTSDKKKYDGKNKISSSCQLHLFHFSLSFSHSSQIVSFSFILWQSSCGVRAISMNKKCHLYVCHIFWLFEAIVSWRWRSFCWLRINANETMNFMNKYIIFFSFAFTLRYIHFFFFCAPNPPFCAALITAQCQVESLSNARCHCIKMFYFLSCTLCNLPFANWRFEMRVKIAVNEHDECVARPRNMCSTIQRHQRQQ